MDDDDEREEGRERTMMLGVFAYSQGGKRRTNREEEGAVLFAVCVVCSA